MTTDLDRLIEAVGAGGHFHCSQTPLPDCINEDLFVSAYSGSLDAAVALWEALLPGWGLSFRDDGWAVAYPPSEERKSFEAEIANRPARALLLATLRAYRSTREGG